ncbi:hypothetical protein B296_00020699 [Ensete ventricosum]|uniref:Alpha-L-arabinofuranosidase 1 catalytic domain-containing protein n=1 Tax=Ensete ventricosum TaxID=4639 RepID=A0A426ZX68_ENSVE|nr:hypothetical protein B296_00020699 [Ensete ventricosum]
MAPRVNFCYYLLIIKQDTLDAIEFARGDSASKWGSIRASMGHPEPFQLYYVALGNQDCSKRNYKGKFASSLIHLRMDLCTMATLLQIVNYGSDLVNLKISVTGLENDVCSCVSKKTVLTGGLTDENSFGEPEKVFPVSSKLPNAGSDMDVVITPYSINAFDLFLAPSSYSSAM